MIPAPFDYVRAGSVGEALAALGEYGEDAKVLAGGHSLLPLMKLRFAFPTALVDIARIEDLVGVRTDGEQIVIGAATTHHDVATSAAVQEGCGLLAEAAEMIGDAQVRHRGTIGGALAHGDAAGDLPAVALALDAELVAEGPGGRRTIPAAEFFRDYLETALAPDEVLSEVRVPRLDGSWGFAYEKFNRVAQAWATVGVAALVRRDNGVIDEARVALTNMGNVPLRANASEQALAGSGTDAIAESAAAAAEGTDPPGDLNADPAFRQHLARVLTRRALERAASA